MPFWEPIEAKFGAALAGSESRADVAPKDESAADRRARILRKRNEMGSKSKAKPPP